MSTREQANGRNGVDPLQTMDAMVWVNEFMRLFGHRKDEIDASLMLAWFAHAIMRGFDEATQRNKSALADARRAGLEEAVGIIDQCGMELDDSQWQSKLTCHVLIEAIRDQAQAKEEA